MAVSPTAENRLEPGKVIAFARNLDLVGQQRKARLLNHVMADTAFSEKGDRITDELMGLSEPEDVLNDIGDTPGGTVSQSRRVSFFRTYNDGNFVGKRDAAEKLINPQNPVVRAMGAGRERRRDEDILGAPGKQYGIFGDSMEVDKDGDTVFVAFPTATNVVPFNFNGLWKGKSDGDAAPGTAPTVLSPQKLRRTKVILDKSEYAELDNDLPIIALEEEDLQNFGTSIEMLSKDYTTHDMARAEKLVNGDLDVFKGFRFVKLSNGRLPKVPGQTNRFYAPVWFKSAMLYKERPLVQTRIQEMPNKMYRWHAYYEAQATSLRREDSAVVWIEVER
jgi:capsid protein